MPKLDWATQQDLDSSSQEDIQAAANFYDQLMTGKLYEGVKLMPGQEESESIYLWLREEMHNGRRLVDSQQNCR